MVRRLLPLLLHLLVLVLLLQLLWATMQLLLQLPIETTAILHRTFRTISHLRVRIFILNTPRQANLVVHRFTWHLLLALCCLLTRLKLRAPW